MCHEAILPLQVLQQHHFEFIIACHLRYSDEDGSLRARSQATQQDARTLFPADAIHAVNYIFIVPSLVRRQLSVVLHPHIHHITWIAKRAPQDASGRRTRKQLPERRL